VYGDTVPRILTLALNGGDFQLQTPDALLLIPFYSNLGGSETLEAVSIGTAARSSAASQTLYGLN
jgi:hypothetical protein